MKHDDIVTTIKSCRTITNFSDFQNVVIEQMGCTSRDNDLFVFFNFWKYITDSCLYEIYKHCLSLSECKKDYRAFFKPNLLSKIIKLNAQDTIDYPYLMSVADAGGYIAIYHGNAGKTMKGACSWSLKKDIAMFFGNRNALFNSLDEYYIVTGRVKSENIIAYITDRNEEEIVVLPENVEYSFRKRELFKREDN